MVMPRDGLEQNNRNPIMIKTIPSVPIAGCLPLLESQVLKNVNFGLGAGWIFPNRGRPQFLQNLLSAVFAVPQWLQNGINAILDKIPFTPGKAGRVEEL
jgi:hypothetical protein